jgi:hypothetical protein
LSNIKWIFSSEKNPFPAQRISFLSSWHSSLVSLLLGFFYKMKTLSYQKMNVFLFFWRRLESFLFRNCLRRSLSEVFVSSLIFQNFFFRMLCSQFFHLINEVHGKILMMTKKAQNARCQAREWWNKKRGCYTKKKKICKVKNDGEMFHRFHYFLSFFSSHSLRNIWKIMIFSFLFCD